MINQSVRQPSRNRRLPHCIPITKKVSHYFYNQEDFLGEGSFSKVYRGSSEINQQMVAIKVIELNPLRMKNLTNLLSSQISILKDLDQANILKCFEVLTSNNNCYIITQLCNGGTLEQMIKKNKRLKPNRETNKIIFEIYQALRYLFQKQILHRDLKSANVLFHNGVAKVADFGFAKKNDYELFKDIYLGSPLYMSPEGLLNNIYGPKTDVWSFGIILFEMLHGITPFGNCKAEHELKAQMLVPFGSERFDPSIPHDLRSLILQCLEVDEKRRISINEIQQTPFFSRLLAEFRGQTMKSGFSQMYNNKYASGLNSQAQADVMSPYSGLNFRSNSQSNTLKNQKRLQHQFENTNRMNIINQRNDSVGRNQQTPDTKQPQGLMQNSVKSNRLGGNRFTPYSHTTPQENPHRVQPKQQSTEKYSFKITNQVFSYSIKTFRECLTVLHYCRLCYKTVKLLKSQGLQRFALVLSTWVMKMMEEIRHLTDHNQIDYSSTRGSPSEREKKLKQVVKQYIVKYTKQLSFQQAPVNIDKILQETLTFSKHADNLSQSFPLKHYLFYLSETTRILKDSLANKDLTKLVDNTNIEGFLAHHPNDLNQHTYNQMRNASDD